MSSAALRAKALLEQVVAPHVRPGDRISRQKRLAFDLLRMEEIPAGWSKIEAAWKGRAGAPTLVVIEQQAEKHGLLQQTRREATRDDGEYLERLRWMRSNAHGPTAEVLDWAIERLARGG